MPTAACSKVASRRCPGPPSGTAYSAVQPGTADVGARIGESARSVERIMLAPSWWIGRSRNDRPGNGNLTGQISHRLRCWNRSSFGHPAFYASSSSLRSDGIFQAVTPTTPSVTKPPKITDGTVPSSLAATPDSKEPTSFDEPINIWLAADTRPSRCGGVRTVSNVDRITTLTLSTIPPMTSSSSEIQNQRDSANKIHETPNM